MWQTRTICSFIGATVPVEGPTNALVEAAERIGRTDEQVKEAKPEPAANVGSFEAFMSTFASPRRWAGGQ